MNKRDIAALLTGTLFGLGLSVSQMVNPAKVLNFLDIAGNWDPTLALVMAGAVLVTLPAFHWLLKRPVPLFDKQFHLPSRSDIDNRLVLGAALFGVGWGIAGLCPGPAITGLVTGQLSIVGFVLAMLAGSWLASRL